MFDLRYTPPKNRETDHWWGTAAPFLTFLAAHKLRRNELRVGHSKMPISKGKDPKFVNVSGWGLDAAHHILLEGISYPPDKKSAMAQSLGPMTIAIQCARMWHMAMKKAFAHIPDIDSIIAEIKGQKSDKVKGLFSALADITLITTARNTHRATFPPSVFLTYFTTSASAAHYTAVADGHWTNNAKFAGILPTKFDVSGKGMHVVWRSIRNRTFLVPRTCTAEISQQAVFHATFGTFCEDLGLLSSITNVPVWATRSEMGDFMKNYGQTKESMAIRLPQFTKVAKLANANMSGLLTSTTQQIHIAPVFSGKRRETFTDAFFKHMTKDSTYSTGSGRGIVAGSKLWNMADDAYSKRRTKSKDLIWREIANELKIESMYNQYKVV